MEKAIDIALACRQNMMLSYIFAHFVIQCNQTAIFEENQRDLEQSMDALDAYLQSNITARTIDKVKAKIWDKAK